MDRFEKINRSTDAHEVTWSIRAQVLRDRSRDALALFASLTYGQATDRVAIERKGLKKLRAFLTEVLVTRALNDSEKRLGTRAARLIASLRPTVREFHRPYCLFFRRSGIDTLVEHHH